MVTATFEAVVCPDCGNGPKAGGLFEKLAALVMHQRQHCTANPDRGVLKGVAKDISRKGPERSKRGQALIGYGSDMPDVLQQVDPHPGGPWAYYIRPDGATVTEALTRYPNGANTGRHSGRNADYYRNRMAKKGFEYIGPTLTSEGIRNLIKVIEKNRPDYILFLKEEIEKTRHDTAEGSGLPQDKLTQQFRRAGQLRGQLALAEAPIDPDKVVKELEEVAQAQKLAQSFTGAQFEVLKGMMDERLTTMAKRFVPAATADTKLEPTADNTIDLTEAGEGF